VGAARAALILKAAPFQTVVATNGVRQSVRAQLPHFAIAARNRAGPASEMRSVRKQGVRPSESTRPRGFWRAAPFWECL